ncbi:hypothetical protein BOV90_04885 [Solemya velum gill symbiont]|uniref:hybrid sensor histidine kinase/response regulator n=2 Tax=Solemya velum gill symbiont TaxID=2340 RepID=UPI000998BC7C|nr:PAS-domain containing protein [Solemya velum gill symbiont]OOY37025.1 hypothetical protein BOV89_09375 [Solemya velum gill symbiont]OOY40242.1 hypothetical protein BOV90_04885 [Solemya velum gill symbiont]OOY44487.1 hypothetical protein BOV91_01215 [Solemya velum gill symbiont]OOY50564.1 hypothetical protein BOV94_06955 [Solemya velum gill symbiont]
MNSRIVFTLFFPFIRKVIAIAKRNKTTSIADFLATRYGKSRSLAALVTLIAFIGTLPYIALQIKAISSSFDLITGAEMIVEPRFHFDTAIFLTIILAIFSILFGARTIDVSQHHKGLIYAISFESLVKLFSFLVIAFMAYQLIVEASEIRPDAFSIRHLLWSPFESLSLTPKFFTTLLLSAGAIFLLPRQFHVMAVEASGSEEMSSWGLPIYLLLFSVAVVPIAAAGLMIIGSGQNADLYVLLLPMSQDNYLLSVLAYLGGFAAATGMVIVATLALSTMVSNDLIVPVLVRFFRSDSEQQMYRSLLIIRRATILLILLLAYLFYAVGGTERSLQSIGLVSFAAAIQFLPSFLGSVYWYRGHKNGAIAGLLIGMSIWFYSLLLPTLSGQSWMPEFYIELLNNSESLFNPQALFGYAMSDSLTHAVFWSLLFNTLLYIFISLRSHHKVVDRLQAAVYIDQGESFNQPEKDYPFQVGDLFELCSRFTGEARSREYFSRFGYQIDRSYSKKIASSQFTLLAERLLASSIGMATASSLIRSLAQPQPASRTGIYEFIDQTGQAIEFNRELLQVTLDHIDEAVSVVDKDLRLVAWNRQYIDFFEYEAGFIRVGKPVKEVIRRNLESGYGPVIEGDIEQHVDKRLKFLRDAKKYSYIRDWQNGRTVQIAGAHMPDGGYITTYTDITPLKQAEKHLAAINETLEAKVLERTEMLSDVNQQLEELLDTRKHFLAAASHDLIQPLGASKLYMGALKEDLADDATKFSMADNAYNAIITAESLLKSLLYLSRMDSGLLTPELDEFPLEELFASIENEFAPRAEQKGLQLRVLPTNYLIRSDRSLMLSLLQNLVANAIRYTKKGAVMVLCRRKAGQLVIEVRDSGDGIAEERQQEIFQAFKQLENGSVEGVGLGLAICQRAANLLQHDLSLRSSPGHGSTFKLTVPLAGKQVMELQHEVEQSSGGDLAGLRVAYIDDDRLLLNATHDLMKRWGIDVTISESITEFRIMAAAGKQFDVILMDYQLGEGANGLELLELYRREVSEDFLGILATAKQSEELRSEVEQAGFKFMAKPLGPARLRSVLQSYVR